MVIESVSRFNSTLRAAALNRPNMFPRVFAAISRRAAQIVCGMHGHSILLHFEPNKLSLQCALCGYESSGWEVGRPLIARRKLDGRVHNHQARPDRRHPLRAVPTDARLAS